MDDAGRTVSLPASWYPDPDDPAGLRWWDGAVWTEHVQSLPAPPPLGHSDAKAVADSFVIKTRIPLAGTWYSETGSLYTPPPSTREIPVTPRIIRSVTSGSRAAVVDPDLTPRWTAAAYLLAVLPFIAFVVQYVLWKVGDTPGEIFTRNPLVFWLVPGLLIVASPILATVDRSALAARGIRSTPSGLTGILPPVYLILRTITVGASSIPPLIIWCALALSLYNPISNLIGAFFLQLSLVSPVQ